MSLLESVVKDGLNSALLCEQAYNRHFDHLAMGYIERAPMIEFHQTQCHVLADENFTHIVFPGTKWKEKADIKNAIARRYDRNVPQFGIHKGVNRGLNYIWDRVASTIMLPPFKDKPLWIQGHSQGGGYATETARRLTNVHCVHTFGAFLLYDERGHRAYPHHGIHFTWVNCADFVSRYPLRRIGEEHVGQMLYMTRDNDVLTDVTKRKFYMDFLCSPFANATDHRIDNYINRLQEVYENVG